MVEILYCTLCREEIKREGTLLNEVFESMCSFSLRRDGFLTYFDEHVERGESALMKELENKGYVVSTEFCDNGIIIKPLGVHLLGSVPEPTYQICFDRTAHD